MPELNEVRLTYIGGPTILIEIGGLRSLTDPTFDPPGDYQAGSFTHSKLAGPAEHLHGRLMDPLHRLADFLEALDDLVLRFGRFLGDLGELRVTLSPEQNIERDSRCFRHNALEILSDATQGVTKTSRLYRPRPRRHPLTRFAIMTNLQPCIA